MISNNLFKNPVTYVMSAVGLIAVIAFARGSAPLVQEPEPPPYVRDVRVIKTDRLGIPNPAGLAYSPDANSFLILEARNVAQSADSTQFYMVSQGEDFAGSVNLAATATNPLNMTFDGNAHRLLALDPASNQLLAIQTTSTGRLDPNSVTRFDAASFGLQAPQGMAVDPASGHLFILDSAANQIVRVDAGPDQGFGGVDDQISQIDLNQTGLVDLQGIAFNPANDHLYVLSPASQTLYELNETGQVVSTRDLADNNDFRLRNPQGMVFAPSGDVTDDPAELSLYITDTGLSDGASGASGILELSLTQPPAPDLTGVPIIQAVLEPTNFATSGWPSPDPMAVAYIPTTNRLMITDSEIEEAPAIYFQGVNVFQSTLGGSLISTHTTIGFSNEPTGVAFNPNNGHFFICDDDADEVFEIDPGPNGTPFNSDDIRTSFDTRQINQMDAEDIVYDTVQGHLFIADGVNSEVYEISPGANGVFDGIAPGGDDVATHFDSASLGVADPEGIAFNPDTNTIYLTGHGSATVVEMTRSGTIVRVIDISFLNPDNPSGLAYGPSSANPAQKSLYITDRAQDNDQNPNENDGQLYEISIIGGGPVPTLTSTPTATGTAGPSPTPSPTPTLSGSDPIFADGFESGDFSAWSANKPDLGDLSVSSAAAMIGSNGMQALIDDAVAIYVTDELPNSEPRYRARFYFDPNSITMADADAHFIFYGFTPILSDTFRVEFSRSAGNYRIRGRITNDVGTLFNTSQINITDGPHFIEIDWQAATGPGANNGSLTLWIDNVQVGSVTGVDNDTMRTDLVRLGAVSGMDVGTGGTYFFDAFESRRLTYIGPAPSGPTPTNTPTNTALPPTATNTPTNTAVPPTATATNTPTNTAVPPTATATNTPTNTAVPPTATATNTPTNTAVPPTATATNTPTNTAVPPTATATNTPTNTAVPPTATATNTPTNTAVPPTATNTPPGPTATNTPTNTAVPPTATATNTPTNTAVPPTATATNTPTNTAVPPTATATNTPTNTAVPPTATATNTPTNTAVPPTATATNTPTNTAVPPTATATNTPTNTAVPPTATNTPTSTATSGAPVSTTIIRQVSASSDDVNQDGNALALSATTLWLGNSSSAASSYTGIRFNNLTVPPGATINSAHLEVRSSQSQWISFSFSIAAESIGNSPTFSAGNPPSQRVLTTQTVNHSSNVQWLANTWYSLNEINAVIQQVVNRPDWQSGNSLTIIMRGTGSSWGRKFITSWNGSAANAPRLVVSYTSGSAPTSTPTAIAPTNTPTNTATAVPPTVTNTPTNTPPGPTSTNTSTPTPTNTLPGPTATNTPTPTNTPPGPTATNTSTPTNTAVPPTATNTSTSTATPVVSGPTTITMTVSASTDDVNQDGTALASTSGSLWLGTASSATSSYSGIRFTNLGLPPGATINSARLEVYSSQSQWIAISLSIAAEAAGNSSTFSATSLPSQRVLTTQTVSHSSNVQWLVNTWYALDEIAAVIQEVVNRPDWQSGNSLSVILRGTGNSWGRKFITSWNSSPATAPRLVITYTP